MLRMLVTFCVLGFVCNAVVGQEYNMCYEVGEGAEFCMNVTVDSAAQTIHFHMADSDDFEDVETLEDYNTGFAASRVPSQDACYVRRLVTSMTQQVAFIQGHQQNTQSVDSDVKVMAVPLDNPVEEIGDTLADFCGDLPVYKLVKDDIDNYDDDDEGNVGKRQVSVTFRRCLLFCFIAKCFTTTLTVPTGSTITFFWFFG